ncbi:MAG: GntR family transcriptional regulator [Thermodesulfobacteriota bacterium]
MTFTVPNNLSDIVVAEISEKIIRNELKPGERILETKLAEELGVSRSPIREALQLLGKNKLVEIIPRKGARVTEITPENVDWFYDIFEALYGMVARRATERATEKDFQALGTALEKIECAAREENVEKYYDGIFEFAAVSMKAARNPMLKQTLLELWPYNRRIQYASLSYRKADLEKNKVFFQRMAKYASEGKPEEAVRTIQDYARNEKTFALKMLKDKTGHRP